MKRIKQKNQGSTIIIVIVAISFIAILGTVALSISAANVQMKSVERKSKENFYNAEVALDELKANLETQLGTLVETVYKNTMIDYANIPLGERNDKFKTTFLTEYLKQYATEGVLPESIALSGGSCSYDFTKLEALLVKTKDKTDMENKGKNTLEWKYNKNNKKEQYIYFRNVTMKYVDDSNYISRIVTDIKVTIPDVNMEAISNMSPFTDCALVANKSLQITNAKAAVNGNVYAGEYGIFTEGSAAKLSIQANQVITRGNIKVKNGATLIMDDNESGDGKYNLDVWAKNIETEDSAEDSQYTPKMDLSGNFYIADDTTLNATNSQVTYHGNYYGYGYNQTDKPEESSAMIINRSNCKLDLSKIVNLFIAGRAFVTPSTSSNNIFESNANYFSNYVRTGEAISTKGNQSLYRLPEECVRVKKKDGTKISVESNPLPIEEYQKILDEGGTFIADVESVLPFSNKKLSNYVDQDKPYVTIFDQTGTSTYVYFYPNFKDVYSANVYFEDFCKSGNSSDMDKLKERMKEYQSSVILPEGFTTGKGRKTFAGNVLFYNNDTQEFKLYDNSVDAKLPQQFQKESSDLSVMYQAYCTKLLPSISMYSESEIKEYDNLFDQLIIYNSNDESHKGMKELLDGATSKVIESSGYGSIQLVDNQKDKIDASVFDEKSALTVDDSIAENVHLIVATGDVYVKRNFTGVVISKGIIRMADGVTVTADSNTVFHLVSNSEAKTIFRDYNGFGSQLTTTEHKQFSTSDLITTENWKKD